MIVPMLIHHLPGASVLLTTALTDASNSVARDIDTVFSAFAKALTVFAKRVAHNIYRRRHTGKHRLAAA